VPLTSHNPLLQTLFKAGGKVYAVGGSVRDELLERPTKDQDLLVSQIPMERLCEILAKFGYVKKVGKSFGVLKFKPHDAELTLDIALPRKEQSTGTGHRDFEVEFDPFLPIEQDLGRRDFTINAIAKDLASGAYIDPFGGKIDLAHKILKVVFLQAFEEDPLRLLRGIQFAARLNLTIEPQTLSLMKKNAALIKTVSPERILEELKKLFSAEKPSVGFDLMREVGLLSILFPEVERMIGVMQPARHGGDVYTHTMRVLDAARSSADLETPGDLEVMFAALFHDLGKPYTRAEDPKTKKVSFYGHQIVSSRLARKWMHHYPIEMLGVNPQNILNLVFNHMFETKSFYGERAIRRFIRKIGQDLIFKLIDLRIADKKGGGFPHTVRGVFKLRNIIKEELAKKPPFSPKDLKLNGHHLMELGFPEGPTLGKILKDMVDHVLADPENNTLDYLKNFALTKYSHLLASQPTPKHDN